MPTQDPTIKQKNIVSNFSMQDFISKFNELKGPAKSCRFAVEIVPRQFMQQRLPNNDLIYMCESAQFPGRGFGVTEVRYYGPSKALPNNTEYDTASFSFICRQSSKERFYFDEWMNIINPIDNFNFEYANNYYCDIKIYQFAEFSTKVTQNGLDSILRPAQASPDVIYGWTLRNAWPILVTPQQVTWQDQDILRLQVTFTYRYWDTVDFVTR